MSGDTLDLGGIAPVAEGGERLVFVHPGDPTRLIKVLKHRPKERFTRWTFGHLSQRYIPAARYRPVVKQYDEYRRLIFAHLDDPGFVLPVSHLYGFVRTSRGLGGITERVTDAEGGNGPTLAGLVTSGKLTDALLDKFNTFVGRLYETSVAVGDVGPANFVWGHRHIGGSGERTPPQWVMVDGFGDRYAVTVRSVSHRARVWGLDDCFKRNALVRGLRWNAAERRMERDG